MATKNAVNVKAVNVKLEKEDYDKLLDIKQATGIGTMSNLIRVILKQKIKQVEISGDPLEAIVTYVALDKTKLVDINKES